eukprot:Clim_evm76s88 gene=Clim_evmTU76s88
MVKLWQSILALFVLATSVFAVPGEDTTPFAYVSAIDSENFLQARVLGQSIRDSDTEQDMVALCSEDVTAGMRKILTNEGWQVRDMKILAYDSTGSPGVNLRDFPRVYAWTLTEYEKIVYLEPGMLVYQNLDDLFRCEDFCAAFEDSDLFSTDVMVVRPSTQTFRTMIAEIAGSKKYAVQNDMIIINHHYIDLKEMGMFDKNGAHEPCSERNRDEGSLEYLQYCRYQRLPAGYHASSSIYYAKGKWIMPESELFVINFDLDFAQPWHWATYALFDLNWFWLDFRRRLPTHEADHLIQYTAEVESSISPWGIMPLVIAIIGFITRVFWWPYCQIVFEDPYVTNVLRRYVNQQSVWWTHYGLLAFFVSFVWAFEQISPTAWPWIAWIYLILWMSLIFGTITVFMCRHAYVLGGYSRIEGSVTKLEVEFLHSRAILESVVWALAWILMFYTSIFIPYNIARFWTRVQAFACLLVFYMALIHTGSRRLLTIWFQQGMQSYTSVPRTRGDGVVRGGREIYHHGNLHRRS